MKIGPNSKFEKKKKLISSKKNKKTEIGREKFFITTYLCDYLSNNFRNNKYSLLDCELIADNSHISSKYENDVLYSRKF